MLKTRSVLYFYVFLTITVRLSLQDLCRPVTTSLLVEDELVHVGYAEEREDLFILALPASKASAKEVAQIVRDTVRKIPFLRGTFF